MNGSVVFSKDEPPPSLANAMSSTATRPVSLSAAGKVRGVRKAKRGNADAPRNGEGPPKVCPASTAPPYARALAAGTKYLLLGQQLQGRYRDIRRADDLGDAMALTPDYRAKAKKARELHQHLLDDYREM